MNRLITEFSTNQKLKKKMHMKSQGDFLFVWTRAQSPKVLHYKNAKKKKT